MTENTFILSVINIRQNLFKHADNTKSLHGRMTVQYGLSTSIVDLTENTHFYSLVKMFFAQYKRFLLLSNKFNSYIISK